MSRIVDVAPEAPAKGHWILCYLQLELAFDEHFCSIITKVYQYIPSKANARTNSTIT